MITKISVTGFKSLNNFKLKISPGLNILVGPNGSGKTNIVAFFEFLSNLAKSGIPSAVAGIGGAGALFTRKKTAGFAKSISAIVSGCVKIKNKKYFLYKYAFSIKWQQNTQTVDFHSQEICVRHVDKFVVADDMDTHENDWEFVVRQDIGKKGVKKISVARLEGQFKKSMYLPWGSRNNTKKIGRFLERGLAGGTILNCLRFYANFPALYMDIIGGESYNIIPSHVKLPEDSTREPLIAKDGVGLAATLYSMTNEHISRYPRLSGGMRFFQHMPIQDKINKEKLLKYIKIANPCISDIDVRNDPFSNHLNLIVTIASGRRNIQLPFSSMSDGTIKWITLITAILGSFSVFSIEEPENYLHPLIQSQLLQIIRDIIKAKDAPSFTLMTTHSETILNSSDPDELVVVSFADGRTKARRCLNTKVLNAEIKKTGFGLGYYYLTGVLNHE